MTPEDPNIVEQPESKSEQRTTYRHLEGRVLKFDDPDTGKSTEVKIVKVNRILGGGDGGRVSEVEVEVSNEDGTKTKTITMAIKEYWDVSKEYLKESYDNYRMLLEADIATWPTYRINEENYTALMTLGSKDGSILLSGNDSIGEHYSNEHFEKNPLKEIENIDEFVEKLKEMLEKINAKVYRTTSDKWFFIFKPSSASTGSYEIDSLIGDLEIIDKGSNPYYKRAYGPDLEESFVRENLSHLETALFGAFAVAAGNREAGRAFSKMVMDRLKN